jgi:hypothetical protein
MRGDRDVGSAAGNEDLHTIYDNLSPGLVLKPQVTEVTSIFAGAGILALVMGGLLRTPVARPAAMSAPVGRFPTQEP